MSDEVNQARAAFEQEMQRITGKPSQQVTERLLDLFVAVITAMRRSNNGK